MEWQGLRGRGVVAEAGAGWHQGCLARLKHEEGTHAGYCLVGVPCGWGCLQHNTQMRWAEPKMLQQCA